MIIVIIAVWQNCPVQSYIIWKFKNLNIHNIKNPSSIIHGNMFSQKIRENKFEVFGRGNLKKNFWLHKDVQIVVKRTRYNRELKIFFQNITEKILNKKN